MEKQLTAAKKEITDYLLASLLWDEIVNRVEDKILDKPIIVEGEFKIKVNTESLISYWAPGVYKELPRALVCFAACVGRKVLKGRHDGTGKAITHFNFCRGDGLLYVLEKNIEPVYQFDDGPLITPPRELRTGRDYVLARKNKEVISATSMPANDVERKEYYETLMQKLQQRGVVL